MDSFWDQATKDASATQVRSQLYDVAKKTFPSLTDKQWEEGMTTNGTAEARRRTRVTWKYACTRTVTGTPQYILNGVPFAETDSSWKLNDWLNVIDPLVQANRAWTVSTSAWSGRAAVNEIANHAVSNVTQVIAVRSS